MTDSNRVPGYPMRYIAAKKLDEDMSANMHANDVQGDGQRGVPVRTAKPEDATRVPRPKRTPLY